MPKLNRRPDDPEDDEEPEEASFDPSPAAYRVSYLAPSAATRLEQRALEAEARARDATRELYAARATLRRRRAAGAAAAGGWGALLGSLAGSGLHLGLGMSADMVTACALVGVLLAGLGSRFWEDPPSRTGGDNGAPDVLLP